MTTLGRALHQIPAETDRTASSTFWKAAAVVCVGCAAPLLLMSMGVDFGTSGRSLTAAAARSMTTGELGEAAHLALRGHYTHTLLEWTAVCAAAIVGLLTFIQYRLTREAEDKFRERTTDEWLTTLEGQGIPAGPVRFVEELFDDPQVLANGLVADLEHRDAGTLRMVGPLARFSETPLQANPSPALGQHTDEILGSLGFSEAEIQRWRELGVVG